MNTRLKQSELHDLFVHDLGEYVIQIEDTGRKPLLLSLSSPFYRRVKAYIFNCTAPPGGRSIDEFKVQLILDGQKRGERGKFDDTDGRTILIVGYACPFVDNDDGVWVLFELDKHREFAYSANIQIYLRQLLKSLETDVFVHKKHNNEIVVLSQRKYLKQALNKRFDIDFQIMVEKVEDEITGI